MPWQQLKPLVPKESPSNTKMATVSEPAPSKSSLYHLLPELKRNTVLMPTSRAIVWAKLAKLARDVRDAPKPIASLLNMDNV